MISGNTLLDTLVFIAVIIAGIGIARFIVDYIVDRFK